MARKCKTAAQAEVAKIDRNVDDMYRNKISYGMFKRRNENIWKQIKAKGKRHMDAVLACLRVR